MEQIIKVQNNNSFLLNKELLGLREAQLWIGPNPDGPGDDDDQRILQEREEKIKEDTKRVSGIEAVDLVESEKNPGWFEVDTSDWAPGIYRFMIHSYSGVQAPWGTPLREIRDGEYSWPNLSDDFIMNMSDEQRKFLYLEPNKRGFCFRIAKTEKGEILPAGDGPEWIPNWLLVKKEVEEHTRKKLKK